MIRSADLDIGIVRLIANCTGCLERTSSLPVGYTYVTMAIVLVNIAGNLLAALILSDRVWTRSPLATILKAVSVFEILFNVLTLVAVTCQLTEPLKPFLPLGPSVVAAVETLLLMCDSLIIGFQMARNWSVTVLALFRYDMVCCSRTVRRPNDRLGVFSSGDVLVKVFVGLALFCCGLAVPRMFEDSPIICVHSAVICDYSLFLGGSRLFQYGYLGLVMFTFQSGGPIFITSFVSIRVIQKIQDRHKLHVRTRGPSVAAVLVNSASAAAPSRFQRSQRNPGTLILAVCVTFTVLELPSFFSKLAFFVFQIGNIHVGVIPNLLIYLDSSLNLFIYLASNKTFRKATLNRLHCRNSDPVETQSTGPAAVPVAPAAGTALVRTNRVDSCIC